MQKARRDLALRAVTRGTGERGMSWQSSPRGGTIPLFAGGTASVLGGRQRLFPAWHCRQLPGRLVSLPGKAGHCRDKSFCLLQVCGYRETHQALALSCALRVTVLAALFSFPPDDCKPQMGSQCRSRMCKAGSFFASVSLSSRSSSQRWINAYACFFKA